MLNDMEIDSDSLKESISDLLDIANEREIPLADVQAVHRSVKSSLSARNFDKLKGKLNTEFDIDKLILLEERLRNLIDGHISFDDKSISFSSNPNIITIKKALDEVFANGLISDVADFSLYKRKELTLSKVMYQFSIVREINIRQKLSPHDLIDSIADDYQEVIGIKKIPITCHDFIMLDIDTGELMVGIDLAMVLGANDLSIAKNNFFNFIKKEFNISLIDNVLNLFPKIEEFYKLPQDKSNGVVEIYFMTNAGTAHHEILKGNNNDIRTATYHKSGVKGVRDEQINGKPLNNDILPYRITSRFYRSDKDIDISLKSNYIAINTPNTQLFEAQIYGTRNIDDLNFVIRKLIG